MQKIPPWTKGWTMWTTLDTKLLVAITLHGYRPVSRFGPFRAILNPECDAALEGRQSRYLGNFQEFPQPLLLAGGVRP